MNTSVSANSNSPWISETRRGTSNASPCSAGDSWSFTSTRILGDGRREPRFVRSRGGPRRLPFRGRRQNAPVTAISTFPSVGLRERSPLRASSVPATTSGVAVTVCLKVGFGLSRGPNRPVSASSEVCAGSMLSSASSSSKTHGHQLVGQRPCRLSETTAPTGTHRLGSDPRPCGVWHTASAGRAPTTARRPPRSGSRDTEAERIGKGTNPSLPSAPRR